MYVRRCDIKLNHWGSKNPLLFTFPPDVDEESLISGAEQLSRAVLSSDTELVQENLDMTSQIKERKDRLMFLIGFINENGALGKVNRILYFCSLSIIIVGGY